MRLPIFLMCLLVVGLFNNSAGNAFAIQGDQPPTQQSYDIDTSHTSLVFAVSHLGLSYTYGRFNECAGTVLLNSAEPEQSQFDFEIDVASIDTNEPTRDEHLRGPEFFDSEQHPKIKFQSVRVVRSIVPYEELGIRKEKTMYNVIGSMTMRGQTREVELPMQLIAVGRGPAGKERCGFFSKFVIRRSDYGMDAMSNMIGDSIAITFSFEAIKQEAEKADEERGSETSNDSPFSSLNTNSNKEPGGIPEIEEDDDPTASPFDVFGEDNDK